VLFLLATNPRRCSVNSLECIQLAKDLQFRYQSVSPVEKLFATALNILELVSQAMVWVTKLTKAQSAVVTFQCCSIIVFVLFIFTGICCVGAVFGTEEEQRIISRLDEGCVWSKY